MKRIKFESYLWLLAIWLLPQFVVAQSARITEEERTLTTYPYSDPNPVPAFTKARKAKIYPYHLFDGYSTKSVEQKWKVIKLENDYIEVYILPEIGGKVWGAIEKSTGNEFLYKNEVVKFRDISLRGPWTSGGIEFNFGIIGHSPSTAAPVDYKTIENEDGSVSCIVGNLDLTSRTQWAVEIRLPKDKAYFETNVIWDNPTPTTQSYYNWMTGAVKASQDLEFFFPGNTYIEHNGQAKPWPVDEAGNNLAMYSNNNFGSSKAYHITGSTDFMGGYYHDSNFGFGHLALNTEMPGRKLFLWSLAREGGIWEDLLTDEDGQYIEFQAGRLFNQYSPGAFNGPIREVPFQSGATDTWKEIWFPVKDIGGMKEVSKSGILNVTESQGFLEIGVNALAFAESKLVVKAGGKVIYTDNKSFKPMDVHSVKVPWDNSSSYEVEIEGMDLDFKSDNTHSLNRPFTTESITEDNKSPSWLYYEGKDFKSFRDHFNAKISFKECLRLDPFHIDAMAALAEIYFESAQFDSALVYINKALLFDTYHPAVNYQAGNVYRATKDFINATESFGWAARSLEFRTAAYSQMAEIELLLNKKDTPVYFVNQSLDFNKFNSNALQALAVNYRKAGNKDKALKIIIGLKEIYPLSHFANYEAYLLNPSSSSYNSFISGIKNEYPFQTFLELSLSYLKIGAKKEAIELLEKSPENQLVSLWLAYLNQDSSMLNAVANASPAFVFPYRRETIGVLEWAIAANNDWKFKYYLALNYWATAREAESEGLFKEIGQDSDYGPFYSTRAALFKNDEAQVVADLTTAYRLSPEDWRTSYQLIECYEIANNQEEALALAINANKKFKGNFSIEMLYAKQLMNNRQYEESIKILRNTTILPFEGSGQGKVVFRHALLLNALKLMQGKKYTQALKNIEESRTWPENLGVGKPFDERIDERLEDWFAFQSYSRMGKNEDKTKMLSKILSYNLYDKESGSIRSSPNNLITVWSMREAGKSTEAISFLRDWINKQPTNVVAKWVMEVYNGNKPNLPAELSTVERFMLWNHYLSFTPKSN